MGNRSKLLEIFKQAKEKNSAIPGLRVGSFIEAETMLEAIAGSDSPILFMVPAERKNLKYFIKALRCFDSDNIFIQVVGDDPELLSGIAEDLDVDSVFLLTPISAAADLLCKRIGGNGVFTEVLLPWRSIKQKDMPEGRVVDENEAREIVQLEGLDMAAVPVGGGPGPYKSWRIPLWSSEPFFRIVDMNPDLFYALPWGSLLPKDLLNKFNLYGGALPGVISLPRQQFRSFVMAGAVKISFRSDLSLAFLSALRESLYRRPDKLDLSQHLLNAQNGLLAFMKQRIKEIQY